MGRMISQEKKMGIAQARLNTPDAIGPMLGELVLGGNVPIEAVAAVLRVSEPTIYRWMYGQATPVDPDKILKIKRLLTILRKAKRAKDLPMVGTTKERVKAFGGLITAHKPIARPD